MPNASVAGCEHRPNCGGGCVAAQWLALGRVEGVNCEKEFFDSVISDGVVREYLRATNGDLPEPCSTTFSAWDTASGPTCSGLIEGGEMKKKKKIVKGKNKTQPIKRPCFPTYI